MGGHCWGLGVVVVVVCGGMVTMVSTQVVGSSLLSLGHNDTGGGMVAMWLMQAMAMVMVGAVVGSCHCRVGIGCHCCHLVDSAGGGQCRCHRPSSMVGPSLSLSLSLSLITVVVALTVLVVVMAVGKACREVLENIDS